MPQTLDKRVFLLYNKYTRQKKNAYGGKKNVGKLFVSQRKSKKGNFYKCIVFAPENDSLKEIVLSFDELTMHRLAEMEGCTLANYVVEESEEEMQ